MINVKINKKHKRDLNKKILIRAIQINHIILLILNLWKILDINQLILNKMNSRKS